MGEMPRSYAEAPQDIKDAVEQLIRTYGSDPALLAGAFVAATIGTIKAATLAEREACALIIDAERKRVLAKQDGKDDAVDHNLRMIAVLFPDVAAAIRKRGEA